nr:MAG TPA: hypothetical protein [Caudoviricetes sp.]
MRSRYPRNYISEDHYPIKRVVVFFYLHRGAKSTYRHTHFRKVP